MASRSSASLHLGAAGVRPGRASGGARSTAPRSGMVRSAAAGSEQREGDGSRELRLLGRFLPWCSQSGAYGGEGGEWNLRRPQVSKYYYKKRPGDDVSPISGDLLVKRQVEELAEELNGVKSHMEQLSSNLVQPGKEAKSVAERAYTSWKYLLTPTAAFVLMLVVLVAGAIPVIGATRVCDATVLSVHITNFCVPGVKSLLCCEPILSAVDLTGDLECLCSVARHHLLVAAGYNITQLLDSYSTCGGLNPELARQANPCADFVATEDVPHPARPLSPPALAVHSPPAGPAERPQVVEFPSKHPVPEGWEKKMEHEIIGILGPFLLYCVTDYIAPGIVQAIEGILFWILGAISRSSLWVLGPLLRAVTRFLRSRDFMPAEPEVQMVPPVDDISAVDLVVE